jgi:3-hydroxy-D-aspartate aldolase
MPDDMRLHGHLIGRQGSRHDLNSPVLVLDVAALDRNIARMAERARAAGVRLRPHAKTHKSPDIARRQIAAGAVGQCCAKLGEAEALAQAGIAGLHITSPVVARPAIERLVALNAASEGLSVVVDHPDNLEAFAQAFSADRPLGVFIDIDPGIHRTGVTSIEAALELVLRIQALPQLRYEGVQFYAGREQHIYDLAERRAAIVRKTERLKEYLTALAEAGAAAPIVTGGGSGTHMIDLELGVFNELQVGSYVFMDDQYAACEGLAEFERSLFVDTRVVSRNSANLITVDAGLKAFATEGEPPRPVDLDAATYAFMGDEHGAVIAPGIAEQVTLGQRITLSVPHCDPTVNLYDSYHVLEGETLTAMWPVAARGRSR